jgi:GNAT superfamily N-acetyltransferase
MPASASWLGRSRSPAAPLAQWHVAAMTRPAPSMPLNLPILYSATISVTRLPLRHAAGYAYISNVAVSPSAQRRGVASRLMSEAEALAASWGCSKAGLHVNMTNTPALQLYRCVFTQ